MSQPPPNGRSRLPDPDDTAALDAVRLAEWRDVQARARDGFEANWAGSASASVLRDYAAGRAVTVSPPARSLRRAR